MTSILAASESTSLGGEPRHGHTDHKLETQRSVPLIAHVIAAEFQQHQRFITSREIADALLRDPEARRIIDAVVQQRGNTPERTAINMVAWFSQRITAEQSEWHRMFDRTRIGNQYAYKPAATPTT